VTDVSRSTSSRQFGPHLAALVLAALRLRLHIEPPPRLSFSQESK
jgi:hypothetical protein